MDLLYVALTALGSILILFILTKIMGNKQMSQLSMFDYITGITIGSITAEMATALEDFRKPLLAMIIYGLVASLISIVSYRSIKLRRILTGKSMILFEKGKLYEKNLKKAKLDVNEFLTECRISGYFDLSNLEVAILETTGKISFIPLSTLRPVNPSDFQLTPEQEKLVANIIIDGKVLTENLKNTGNDESWLNIQLRSLGFPNIKDIFLATCDCNNIIKIYTKIETEYKRDMLD